MTEFQMLKYPLFDMFDARRPDRVTVTMSAIPGTAHLGMQEGVITLWAASERNQVPKPVNFLVVGTGYVVHEGCGYIGTVMDRGFVWHVFEVPA
jgi:hypothetical protein